MRVSMKTFFAVGSGIEWVVETGSGCKNTLTFLGKIDV